MQDDSKSVMEFRYPWGTGRIAILLSFALFLSASGLCFRGFLTSLNLIALLFAALFGSIAAIRGYQLVIALIRSPLVFHVRDGTFVGKMLSGESLELSLSDIDEIGRITNSPIGGSFTVLITSAKRNKAFLIRNDSRNNPKLINAIKAYNANCKVDRSLEEQRGEMKDGGVGSVELFFWIGFILLILGAFLLFGSPVNEQANERDGFVELWGNVALIGGIFFESLAYMVFRRKKLARERMSRS